MTNAGVKLDLLSVIRKLRISNGFQVNMIGLLIDKHTELMLEKMEKRENETTHGDTDDRGIGAQIEEAEKEKKGS